MAGGGGVGLKKVWGWSYGGVEEEWGVGGVRGAGADQSAAVEE